MNLYSPVAAPSVRASDLADEPRIEEFLARHAEATPFHCPAWLRAIELGCGQKSHLLIAETGGSVTGFLPLTQIRSRLFGSALISSGFAVGGGILADDPASAKRLAGGAIALAAKLDCPGVELRGGTIPAGWHRVEGVYAGFSRPLPADDEAILKSIPKRQRAEVRRALGRGFAVRTGRAPADLAAHFRVYSESVRNHGTPIFPRALFAAVLDAFGDDADILSIFAEGRPVASVLSLYFKGTVYPYWGGGVAAARQLRASELLYYELMRHAAERGCTRFDFGRSKVGTGPYAFKKNWGFEPQPLVYGTHGEARDTNPMSAKYKLRVGLWKKLPLALANRLGPPIARGLG